MVIFALLIGVFLLLMLVVIDGTNAFDQHTDLQTAADASALAVADDLAKGTTLVSTLQGSADHYSVWNNGPDVTGQCSVPTPSPDVENCYVWPYLGDSNTVYVHLYNSCVKTFFGKVANFLTQTSGFSCVTESAHAIAAVTHSSSAPPYTFVALMGDGEAHTLYVQSGGDLNVTDAIYDNACAGDALAPGSCPGGDPQNNAFELGAGNGSLTASQFKIAGGWHNGSGAGAITVKNGNPLDGNYDPPPGTTSCSLSAGYPASVPNTAAGCPLVGQKAIADQYQGLPAPPLGPPAWCTGCEDLPIVKVQRTDGVATVWVQGTLPGSVTDDDAGVSYLGIGGVEDASFEGDGMSISGSGTDASDGLSWVQYASPGPDVPAYDVSSWSLDNGKATLSTATTHTIQSGATIDVQDVDPALNGTHTALDPTGGTTVTFSDDATSTYTITNVALTGGTATLTLSTTPNQKLNDLVTVNTGDPVFDGTYPITAISGNTISYTPKPQVVPITSATISTSDTNPNVCPLFQVCVTVEAANNLDPGDTVQVVTGSGSGTAPYSGTFQVASAPAPTTNQFTYYLTQPLDVSWAVSGTQLTVTVPASVTLSTGISQVTFSPSTADGVLPAYMTKSPLTVTSVDPANHKLVITLGKSHTANNGTAEMTITGGSLSASPGGSVGNETPTQVQTPIPGSKATATAPMVAQGTGGEVQDTGAALDATGNSMLEIEGPGSAAQPNQPCYPGINCGTKCSNGSCAGTPCGDLSGGQSCLTPGTYYGGICIGQSNPDPAKKCDDVSYGGCSPTYTEGTFTGPDPTLTADLAGASPSSPGPTTFSVNTDPSDPIEPGDVIEIDSEKMQVDVATTPVAGVQTLTVVRGFLGDAVVEHWATSGAGHTAATFHTEVPDGGDVVKFASGTYILAGGGLYVCGSTGLDAPHVFIYNTDRYSSEGYIGRIVVATSGAVTLGPLTDDPTYKGITIFQNRNDATDTNPGLGITTQAISYPTRLTLASAIGADPAKDTELTSQGPAEIEIGDVIQIGTEQMLVTNVQPRSTGQTVDVVRGYLNQPAAPHPVSSHAGGDEIQYVTFTGETCNAKAASPGKWDLALISMKSTGANGALGGISGTFYLPAPRAQFGVEASGTADLAVWASCITVDGADSTFDVAPATNASPTQTALVG